MVAPVAGAEPPADPTPAAGSGGDGAAAGDGPVCVICQDDIDVSTPQHNLVLWCGHVFHSACITEWRICANKSDRECPLRCRFIEDPVAP